MLTDTHLSNEGNDTVNNISSVDSEIGFDFLIHLGNITNGDNPEKITRQLMKWEIEKYKNSVKNKKLLISQGNTDGYRNERYLGQLSLNMMTDEIWSAETEFLNSYDNIKKPLEKPYYYIDFPKKNFRVVVLCSYFYQIDTQINMYEKYERISVEQARWLKNEALNCKGMVVLIFSHKIPKSRFSTGKDPLIYNGCSLEPILAILQQAKKNGVNIVGWFSGGYNYDSEIEVGGINHIVIDSQVPHNPPQNTHEWARYSKNRDLKTVNQDCWDAVVVDKKERKIKMFRFGAGEDRILEY